MSYWIFVLTKYEVKIEYLLFVSTHIPSSAFMDTANPVSLSMLTGGCVMYIELLHFLLFSCTSSLVQYQLTVPIPFVIISFPPIISAPLEIMGSIFSVNMSSFENMCAFSKLSTITVESSKSNPMFFEDSTIEDGVWHILSFEIVQYTKDMFFGFAFGVILSCLPTDFTSFLDSLYCFCTFFLKNQLLSPLAIWFLL